MLDLRAAVATLPARQRATLVLRFYCDLSIDQSAVVLGCSAGTVKSQTARAWKRCDWRSGRRTPPVPAVAGPQRERDTHHARSPRRD